MEVLIAVAGATVAIVVWMVRITVRDLRTARAASDQFAGINELNKSILAGLLVVVPPLVMLWIGLPSWVPIAWLVASAIVLAALLFLERRQLPEQP